MAIVKGLNPLIILKNREKIARKLADKYHFTKEDLASFFYTNPSVMGKFLKENGIEASNHQTIENKQEVERLKIARDKKIRRAEESEMVSMLEKQGLWQLPEIKPIKIEALDDFPNAISAKEAIEFLQFGFTMTNVKSYFSLNNVQLTIIKQEFEKSNIKNGVGVRTSKEAFETVKDMVRNGYEFNDAVKTTGLSASENEKGYFMPKISKTQGYTYEDFIAVKQAKNEKQKKYELNKNNSSSKNKYSTEEKEALKEEVFKKWMNAERTQQELALEYGVDRVTIINWVRTMKNKHRDEISQPTVRRRNLSQKTLKEKGLDKYDNPGMMRLKESKEAQGLPIDSPFKKASSTQRQKVSDISQNIYRRRAEVLFGYGPNKEKSMVKGVVQPMYAKRLKDTTDLGKEFESVEGAREYADTHEGEMKSFWDEKYGVSENYEEKIDIE